MASPKISRTDKKIALGRNRSPRIQRPGGRNGRSRGFRKARNPCRNSLARNAAYQFRFGMPRQHRPHSAIRCNRRNEGNSRSASNSSLHESRMAMRGDKENAVWRSDRVLSRLTCSKTRLRDCAYCRGRARLARTDAEMTPPARIVFHLDDVGSSAGSVKAWSDLRRAASVETASVMVPCPWYPAAAEDFRTDSNQDLGIHLTLTVGMVAISLAPDLRGGRRIG